MNPLSSCAITGLGFSELSRRPIGTARALAVQAVCAAAADAGLGLAQIDGLLISRSSSAPYGDLPMALRDDLGLDGLRLLNTLEGEGTSAIQLVQSACLAVRAGMATTVACVFADAPLKPASPTGASAFRRVMSLTGIAGWESEYGLYAAAGPHAMAARRYMHLYGAAEEDFGAYAISCREWACLDERAAFHDPLALADYLAAPYIAEPLRAFDCAYPVNGAVALIVGRADSMSSAHPVYVHGMGQGHLARTGLNNTDRSTRTGAELAAREAYRTAGIRPADVQVAQLYDAFSYLGMLAMEEYGLCERGGAADLLRSGRTRPGGDLPLNTGGGHLSGFYLQGMTPLSEAVLQARGTAGKRQAARHEVVLATGVGGCLDYHAALVLSPSKELA
ncbi:MAG TPA: thiolase family protein [Ramlibacter sp.]|uniref:thiolase family protein n=1 Tax=Ramlibacter sp. TaxID=1917967 RepID=UPI002B762BBF|nr:thiolase family protein [Ramlibacter sp.]HVZ46487.1 thiolase family protein [Ramlibacter sp.]